MIKFIRIPEVCSVAHLLSLAARSGDKYFLQQVEALRRSIYFANPGVDGINDFIVSSHAIDTLVSKVNDHNARQFKAVLSEHFECEFVD